MSEGPHADETVTVSADGVRVEKSFSADEFPVPAVTFRITVDGSDPVQCRMVDDVPDSFPMDRVGFHPDFESEHWTAYEDNRVEFARELGPDEELHTVYGIRADDLSNVEQFLGEPAIEAVPAGETVDSDGDAVEEVLGPDDTEAVREVLAGDRETVPGLEAGNGDGSASRDAVADNAASQDAVADSVASPNAVAAAAESAGEQDGDELDSDEEPKPLELGEPTRGDDPTSSEEAEVTDDGSAVDAAAGEADDDPEPIDLEAPDDTSGADGLDDPSASDDSSVGAEATESAPATEAASDDPESLELDEPGVDDEAADQGEPNPRQPDDDTESAVTPRAPESPDVGSETSAETATPVGTETSAETATPVGTGSVAAALADEIRAGDVADEDLELLGDELELGTPNSVDVRLRRLQSTVEDLAAYTDALEEFLDEEGTARAVLESVQSDLEALSDEVTDLDARIDSAADERAAVSARVDEVAGDVNAVEGRVDGVAADVEALGERLDGAEGDLDALRTRLDELDDVADDLASLDADVDSFDTEMGDVREELAEYDARLGDLRADLESTVADVEGDVQGIEEEIEELNRFRDNLSDAFGA